MERRESVPGAEPGQGRRGVARGCVGTATLAFVLPTPGEGSKPRFCALFFRSSKAGKARPWPPGSGAGPLRLAVTSPGHEGVTEMRPSHVGDGSAWVPGEASGWFSLCVRGSRQGPSGVTKPWPERDPWGRGLLALSLHRCFPSQRRPPAVGQDRTGPVIGARRATRGHSDLGRLRGDKAVGPPPHAAGTPCPGWGFSGTSRRARTAEPEAAFVWTGPELCFCHLLSNIRKK